jgi:hypothetical protein
MSELDSITQTVADAEKVRASVERALAPSRSMADILKVINPPAGFDDLAKAIQTPRYLTAFAEIAKAMQPPRYLSAVSQMMTALQRENRLLAEIAKPPKLFEDVSKHLAQMNALTECITGPFRRVQEMIQSQSAVFKDLSAQVAAMNSVKFSTPNFSEVTLAWNVAAVGLTNRMNDIGLLTQRELLSARLLESPSVYTEFVKQTTALLAADPAPLIATQLRGSLKLAETQLIDIVDTVNAFIIVPDDTDEPDIQRLLTAPFHQQEELLANPAVTDESDTEAMIEASPTAQSVQRVRRVLELVIQCNEACKTSKYGTEIFKPTTRLMTVFNDLPWLTPTDRFRFGDVIDCLYFIFYEGAGKDNLRFLDKNGGPLTEADWDLIWCIKHLRNKWSRHDADHGKEKDIKKSWDELAAKFRWLGLAEHPTSKQHYQQLHNQLLVLAEIFLTKILSCIKL